MTVVVIECLACGCLREVAGPIDYALDAGSCPRCGYVGWAVSDDLSELERRELRDLPVELRCFDPAEPLIA